MKKSFKLMSAALMALAMTVPAQAEVITFFDGTDQSEYSPIYAYNNDAVDHAVQTILPASYLSAIEGATINSMKFYIADQAGNQMTSGKYAISIATTELNSFYNELATGLTKVAEVAMTAGETEILVNFDQPWFYEGGNIIIEAKVIEAGNYTHVNFAGQTAAGAANVIYGQWTKYTTGFYPKTTVDFEPAEDMAVISTRTLDFGQLYPDQQAEPQTFTVKNLGKNAFTPVFSTVAAPFSVTPAPAQIAAGESVEYTVTFAPTELGDYNQTLTIDCGAAGQFEVALSGVMVERPSEIVVAAGEATHNNVPVNMGSYDYSAGNNQSQMIYNADMLTDLVGKKINGIKFHTSAPLQALNGGNIQLSIKVVEQSAFESDAAIDGMTVVAHGAPVLGESEIVFNFDEPVLYEGGNLAVEALVVEAGSFSFKDAFLGTTTTDYVSYAHFNDLGWETHAYKFLPMTTFSYVKEDTPEPVVVRGDVNGNGDVNIADVTALIDYLLSGNGEGIVIENAKCNADDDVNIADVTALIDYLLSGAWAN